MVVAITAAVMVVVCHREIDERHRQSQNQLTLASALYIIDQTLEER